MQSKAKQAEQEFREAFERLKANRPERLERGAQVTQNNVAREAGTCPSSLRKERYPTLLLEIQAYKSMHRDSAARNKKRSDNRTKSTKERLSAFKRQRDELVSIIETQRDHIAHLTEELERLTEGKVTPL
jgi:predicted RNase H-like nuclease (RuvC/YqgF family)